MTRDNVDTRAVDWLIPWLLGLTATGICANVGILWMIKGEISEAKSAIGISNVRIERIEEDRKDDRRRIDNLEALYFRQ
jgi:hypothetical protein